MTDAQLIYEALVRAGKRLDLQLDRDQLDEASRRVVGAALMAITVAREEISNGLASRGGPRGPIA